MSFTHWFVRLWIVLYNTAAPDLEDLPIDLDPVRLEDLSRVLGNSLETVSSQREDGRPRAGQADPEEARMCGRRDVVRHLGQSGDLRALV